MKLDELKKKIAEAELEILSVEIGPPIPSCKPSERTIGDGVICSDSACMERCSSGYTIGGPIPPCGHFATVARPIW